MEFEGKEELEKEICEQIRKHLPKAYADKDDEYILKWCGHVPRIWELIGNDGFTIENAVIYLTRV